MVTRDCFPDTGGRIINDSVDGQATGSALRQPPAQDTDGAAKSLPKQQNPGRIELHSFGALHPSPARVEIRVGFRCPIPARLEVCTKCRGSCNDDDL